MLSDMHVVYVGGDPNSPLRGWFFEAWQYWDGREDAPWWASWSSHLMPGTWLLRTPPDSLARFAVGSAQFQDDFKEVGT